MSCTDEHHEVDLYDMPGEKIIVDTVQELPDRYRDCMYMELVLEFDYKEIADILKQKAETVRKHLQRGKNFSERSWKKEG